MLNVLWGNGMIKNKSRKARTTVVYPSSRCFGAAVVLLALFF
jgi:hypothetical protein